MDEQRRCIDMAVGRKQHSNQQPQAATGIISLTGTIKGDAASTFAQTGFRRVTWNFTERKADQLAVCALLWRNLLTPFSRSVRSRTDGHYPNLANGRGVSNAVIIPNTQAALSFRRERRVVCASYACDG